jgi:DNA-binding GntR family transcriptional regulator
MTQTLRKPGIPSTVWQEHEHILDEMAAGNGEKAASMMRHHLVDTFMQHDKSVGEGSPSSQSAAKRPAQVLSLANN